MLTVDPATEKPASPQAAATVEPRRGAGDSGSSRAPVSPRAASARREFAALELREEVLQALVDTGYDKPTAIQLRTVPQVLAGRDVLAQAETGSGKTAAFACPLLSTIDLGRRQPQVLVLTPTRELAIQVTAAIQTYAVHLRDFRALSIYGGQGYDIQLTQLKRGVHVVVGTPGRVMDHMRRNTLELHDLNCLVLDEADEMLRMGFVDDVEWILTRTPRQRQILLFSATLPEPIRRIAQQHLKSPQHVTVQGRNLTADAISQRYVETAAREKPQTLLRFLEAEAIDGVIVFVRTRSATVEVAEKLSDAGYSAAPLNGDMAQSMRERTVDNFRRGRLAVLVATDVAARGLDVERVSHVINYDFPNDFEAYVHRIGRTGRAGRSGVAILFVGHREKGQLRRLEGATGQRLEQMRKPSVEAINDMRVANFKQRIIDTATHEDLAFFEDLIANVAAHTGFDDRRIAAALAKLAHGDAPLLLKEPSRGEQRERYDASRGDKVRAATADRAAKRPVNGPRAGQGAPARGASAVHGGAGQRRRAARSDQGTRTYRIDIGRVHGVEAKNVVGAIANESGLDSARIGRITIHDAHSTVDLPDNLDENFFRSLNGVRIAGQALRLVPLERGQAGKGTAPGGPARAARPQAGKTAAGAGNKPGARSKPKAAAKTKPRPKTKSKRTNKDKGKRRQPSARPRSA